MKYLALTTGLTVAICNIVTVRQRTHEDLITNTYTTNVFSIVLVLCCFGFALVTQYYKKLLESKK